MRSVQLSASVQLLASASGLRGTRRAVTALDLTITVLIIGVMSAAALPRFAHALEQMRVRAAAQQIVADLNRARSVAIRQSTTVTATFNTASPGYSLTGVTALNGASSQRLVALADHGFSGQLSAAFNGGVELKWNLYGQPCTGAALDPLVTGSVVVSGGGLSLTITIDPQTGKAALP